MPDFVADLIPDTGAISALTKRASNYLAAVGVDARAAHHVKLVLDELLTNLAMHGVGRPSANVRLSVSPDRVDVQVTDRGTRFEPQPPPDIDLSAPPEGRRVGGLGLLLVHRVTDGFGYERIGDQNRTSFWVRRNTQADGTTTTG
jgi:serine/threonine-protein kinase RsbW